MLRVTKNRKRKYLSLGISCPVNLWDGSNNCPKKGHPNKLQIEKIIANKISDYKDKMLDNQGSELDYTSESLVKSIESSVATRSVFQYFKDVLAQLEISKSIGNAKVYRHTFSILKKHTNEKDLLFSEMNYSFLLKFENYLRSKDISETSLSVHFRTLRSLFNMAIKEGIAKDKDYPFKQYKVSKFDTSTSKRALTKDDIQAIAALKIDDKSPQFEPRHYFLFSYYGQGINFVDIAALKWSHIIGNRVFYTRAKTGKHINFVLLEPAQQIIEYWRPVTGKDKDNYIFPILNKEKHKTQIQIYNRVHKVITMVNKELKELGKQAKIETPITTYVARHTFATVLKLKGVSIAVISEAMGHKTEEITHTYLKSFENEVIDKAAEMLV